MQPSLAANGIVSAVDGLVEHMGVMAAETSHLLFQPEARLTHQILVTAIP
jgi:hypothetical protein